MRNKFIQEILISAVLLILLLLLLNPFDFLMPDTFLMLLIVGFAVTFVAFAAFIWKEDARDEREAAHRMFAGRAAFLVGTAILTVGIVIQSLAHKLDMWLVLALVGMVLAKVIARAVAERRN